MSRFKRIGLTVGALLLLLFCYAYLTSLVTLVICNDSPFMISRLSVKVANQVVGFTDIKPRDTLRHVLSLAGDGPQDSYVDVIATGTLVDGRRIAHNRSISPPILERLIVLITLNASANLDIEKP